MNGCANTLIGAASAQIGHGFVDVGIGGFGFSCEECGGDDGATFVDVIAGDEATADDRAEQAETREWIAAAVQALPERMRTPLMLVYQQGMKYHEVAESLGIPVGTVKSRLHTALARLTRSWQESQGTR